jgi:methylamine dehydrogenase accessory protein MauD
MTLLAVSQVLTWLAVVCLGGLCLALARQIGVLHERIAPAGALSINTRLRAGEAAPQLTVRSLSGALLSIGGEGRARAQLLFFLSPDCPVCKSLLPALKSLARAEKHVADVVLVSDGEDIAHQAYVREHGLQAFPYVVSELLGRSFAVGKLPYAVLIDEGGTIRSMGLVNSREHLDSLFEARARGVATVQEFLARRAG